MLEVSLMPRITIRHPKSFSVSVREKVNSLKGEFDNLSSNTKYLFQGKKGINRLGVLAIILVGLAAGIILSQQAARFRTEAVPGQVDIYFAPNTQSLPPDSSFGIWMNAAENSVSFVRLVLVFDATKVQLTSEIDTDIGQHYLKTVVRKTDMATANSTSPFCERLECCSKPNYPADPLSCRYRDCSTCSI